MLIIADIIIAVLLIGLILLQERSAGSSGLLGGTGMEAPYQTRRGVERIVFWTTVGLAVLFALVSVAKLVIAS